MKKFPFLDNIVHRIFTNCMAGGPRCLQTVEFTTWTYLEFTFCKLVYPQKGVWFWHWLLFWWVSPLSPLYHAVDPAEGVTCGHLVLEVILCKPRLWFLHDVLMLKPKYKTAAIELWFMVDFIMNATSKLENSYHLLFIVYGGCSSLIGCLQLSVILHNFILMCQCFSYICWCLIVVSTRIS